MSTLAQTIARSLSLPQPKVSAALGLFESGATLPFVARYRKEQTGGLDEVQLRDIMERKEYLTELEQRRRTIVEAIREQGKLSDALKKELSECTSKTELEDLYAPYKKRRKTRADTARERGLQPLADKIQAQPRKGHPVSDARSFVGRDRGLATPDEALAGARDNVAETLAQDSTLRGLIRGLVAQHGELRSKLAKKGLDGSQYRDYLKYQERAQRVPSHRYLAVCRGEDEGILSVSVRPDMERTLQQLLRRCSYFPNSPYGPQMFLAAQDALKRLLMPAAERAVRAELKTKADDEAIDVFQRNMEAILLAAPLGPQSVLGIDPGIRTGCKCAMVDEGGALIHYQTLYLVGRKDPDLSPLAQLLQTHRPAAVAVGNGTGGRETEAVVRKVVQDKGLDITVVPVSEAGASVYSASDLARHELPDVDLTVRGAVSIARRLQDPLAELVKVPSKSIGVGQYQHDVEQGKLERRLGHVVESCVNRVGVNVNTASPSLLSYVAGIGPRLAEAVVNYRRQYGAFRARAKLLDIPGLGARTFEQCAGFLRIPGAHNPLGASAVHPERYALVGRMARDIGVTLADLVGNPEISSRIRLERYESTEVGRATLQDIVTELKKPGRDPRSNFEAPAFRDDVNQVSDLELGMVLEGVVTNVTNFGAFVDIGVHRDGLVHISELANRFIQSPHEVVQAGQRIKVKVLELDVQRKRISLSAK